ncbi:hypothetical protein SCANM124S_00658 [Streptomyces canus]|jgi:hypothetical protein
MSSNTARVATGRRGPGFLSGLVSDGSWEGGGASCAV